MNISKNSWHYRMLKFMSAYPADNLCPYVRQVIGHILLGLLAVLVILAIALNLSYPIWRWWETNAVIGFISFCGWIAIGIASVKTYREEWRRQTRIAIQYRDYPAQLEHELSFNMSAWYHRDLIPKAWSAAWLAHDIRRANAPPKPPNIFIEFFRAAHDKVCPILEFRDK